MSRTITLKKLPNHCKRCKKVLRKYNKSGYCSMCGEKTRIERTKEKVLISILIFGFVIMFFGTSFVSAELLQFDNVKSYDVIKQEITITNTFGIGEDIAKIKLNTPTINYVPYGTDGKNKKIAEITLTNLKDYTNAFGEMELYNVNDLKTKLNRQVTYKIITYNNISFPCYQDNKKTCYKIEEVYTPLEKYDFKQGDILTIGIFTDINLGESGEWILNAYGKRLTEWATWTTDSVIISGLIDVGTAGAGCTFNLSGTWYNIAGNEYGLANGSVLASNGTTWLRNTTIATGLRDTGTKSSCAFARINGTDYLYWGGEKGIYGYQMASNGTTWIENKTLNMSIATISQGIPTIFFMDVSWYMIAGNFAGGWVGYVWNGTTFVSNTTIVTGLLPIGNFNRPSAFNLNGTTYMISAECGSACGRANKTFGYVWGAGTWSNSTIANDSINTNQPLQSNYIFQKGNYLYNIVGDDTGTFSGFNSYNPIAPSVSVPAVVLNSPEDYFNTSTPTINFNVTALDYNLGGGISNVSLKIDGVIDTTNTSGKNGTYLFSKVLSAGLHNWSILAYNVNGSSNQSETRQINLTILSPTITLLYPYPFFNTSNPIINFTTSVTDNLYVQNVSLLIDNVLNVTDTSHVNGTYEFIRTPSEGLHYWSILAYDNESNPSQSANRYFTIDYTNPLITFVYPLNTTYYTSYTSTNSLNVNFNWNVYDANLDSCWYSKNGGANTSLVCNSNLTTATTYGSSVNILSCANDTINNIGCSSRTATYKFKVYEINQSYNNPVLENTPQDYYSNIYLDSSLNINSVYFTYNGTNYSAGYSEIGNYTRLEKTNFYTPSVLSNANNSVSWWVLLDDSSRINLSTQLQQVNNLIYSSICNATYPYYIFNISLKDEKTQLPINGTIETDIRIKTANGTTTLFNWTSSFYNTSSYLCSNFPISSGNSYITDGTIKYYASNENYSAMTEYYNLLNFSYNSNTYYQNISLYDLNITEGTEFQLTFKDGSFRTRENILIYVYRQYLPEGSFKVVELPKTDSNGQAVIHLVRNDVIYNLIAVDSSGNVLGTLNNVIAFCEDYTIGSCKINFQGTTSETDLENYISDLGLSYSLTFDDTTNIISFVFSSATNVVKNMRLEVISSAVVTNRTICNNSLSAITGTLTCDVSSIINSSSSVNVKIFSDETEIINEYLSLDTSNWNVKGVIFFGFLLLLIIGIMFIESKEGLIISVILGFIVLISLGIVKGKIIGFTSGVLWLIIVGIILLIKLNKEKQQG